MEILLACLVLLNGYFVYAFFKQRRLNRLLLHIFYNMENKNDVADNMYYMDMLKIKKDMRTLINADLDTTALEAILKRNKSNI